MIDKVITLDMTKQPALPPDHGTMRELALEFEVNDEQSYSVATELIQKSARWTASVEAFFDSGKKQAHAAHKWFTDTVRNLTTPYDVRPILEPKMRAFRQRQERERREAEEKQRREQERAERQAREQAEAIQRQADEARRQGDIRAARAQEQKAVEVVQQAADIAEVGVILPDTRPLGGPGESRPWIGEVTDIKALCKTIGDGTVPLEYLTPVRGQGDQMCPLLVIDQVVLNNLAKRLGKEDLGIPGTRGVRSLQLRFSKSAGAGPVQVGQSEEW